MRRLLLLSIISMLFAFLTGCFPVSEKHYTYVPPVSKADKKCVARCGYAKSNCQRICKLKNARSCKCVVSFNTCYSACGGEVKERI